MSRELDRREIHRLVRARRRKAAAGDGVASEKVAGENLPDGNVPGPTPNPSTNLLLADIAMRMGTYLMRGGVERAFLRNRYGSDLADEIVDNRSIAKTLSAIAVAKMAVKSKVGAALVGTGLVGKVLYDHSKARRAARRDGDATLLGLVDEDS
jgi:hypothetical protein